MWCEMHVTCEILVMDIIKQHLYPIFRPLGPQTLFSRPGALPNIIFPPRDPFFPPRDPIPYFPASGHLFSGHGALFSGHGNL